MLRCRSCLADCLRALAIEAQPSRIADYGNRRHYAFDAITRPGYTGLSKQAQYERQSLRPKERKSLPVFVPKLDKEPNDVQQRALRKELQYLTDPLKLATHIKQVLTRRDDFDKALALVRVASKTMQPVVAWNHIIDYLMSKRSSKSAFKIYNEMKKRAVFPDAHTVTLILRGIANAPVIREEDVGQALALYHSLNAPNSRIKPSVIHTNATLKVCAAGRNMDGIWSIVSRMPDDGRESADNITFSIILNGIRESAIVSSHDLAEEVRMRYLERAVMDGKRVWESVIGKWRAGNLRIDESLVCAMGRLLLIGQRPRDWDDVLSLVEQTMDMPRLVPSLGSAARQTNHLTPNFRREEPSDQEMEEQGQSNSSRMFAIGKKPDSVQSVSGGIFAKPGKNTLSMILASCQKMMASKVASDYWQALTDKDGWAVEPDLDNYHTMFRVLRISRASARAVELLGHMVKSNISQNIFPETKTFILVMATCIRDKNNPNVMDHANLVVDYMDRCSLVHPKTLNLFLDLAMTTRDGKAITQAYNRLAALFKDEKQSKSSDPDIGQSPTKAGNDIFEEDRSNLTQSMISCIDILIRDRMVSESENEMWKTRRIALTAAVSRKKTKVDRVGRAKNKERETVRNTIKVATESQEEEGAYEAISVDTPNKKDDGKTATVAMRHVENKVSTGTRFPTVDDRADARSARSAIPTNDNKYFVGRKNHPVRAHDETVDALSELESIRSNNKSSAGRHNYPSLIPKRPITLAHDPTSGSYDRPKSNRFVARPRGGDVLWKQENWMKEGEQSTQRYYGERKREQRRGDRQLRHFKRNEAKRRNKAENSTENETEEL